jgi:hypothetical protein
MARKALFLLPVVAAALAASQWQEISRYIKLRQMSSGGGHPENVPVEGSHAYPTGPGGGEPDGTGDFDSPSRGGGPVDA